VPLRVLIAHNTYRLAGGEDAAVERDRAMLEALGHTVEVWRPSNDAIDGPAARALAGWRAAYSRPARAALAARLAESRADIVHVHNLLPLLTPSILDAAREARAAVVMTLHNYRVACANGLLLRDGKVCELCLGGRPWHAVRHACYRDSRLASLAVARMIARARAERTWHTKVDRFIALTDFARAKVIEAGLPGTRIAVRGSVVDDPGPPGAGPREGFLFVGRLGPEKGIDTLLDAAGRAGVALDIAGDGPLAASVRAAGHVRWLGQLDPTAVRAAMRRARALVVPSVCYEAFPLVIAEAYACGLPVIASRLGSLAELVEDGVTGLLAAPGDAADLAGVLGRADAATMAAMSRAARHRYERAMTPAIGAERLLAIYAEAIAVRDGRP
jgi:glycosyltransferase involved in cell wall biosynthesis